MSVRSFIQRFLPPIFSVILVRTYRSFYLIKNRWGKIRSSFSYCVFGTPHTDTFFGYYDISPFGSRGRVIYLEVPKKSKNARIILNTINNSDYQVITETKAWNWQQGCRLRWFPGKSDSIIFNDFIGGEYISRYVDVQTRIEESLPFPLYDISFDGKYGLSIDFTRLGYMRPGYGYTLNSFEASEDVLSKGIDLCDINKKQVLKTITYLEIAKTVRVKEDQYPSFYLNHLSFSPSGNKFLFFFLQKMKNGFSASLLVYDIIKDIIIPLELDLKVSHYAWVSDDSIICTAYNQIGKCYYYIYDVNTRCRNVFCERLLDKDGHPSIDNAGNIVTDTYPDIFGFQHILRINQNGERELLADVFDYKSISSERRTDLHPRLSPDNLICFDANISGNRQLFILKSE